MPEVLIGGIEYVPRAEIPELSDARLEQALKILTAYLYSTAAVGQWQWS